MLLCFICFTLALLFMQYAFIVMYLLTDEYKGNIKKLKLNLIPFMFYYNEFITFFIDLFLEGVKTIRKKIQETEYDSDKGVK